MVSLVKLSEVSEVPIVRNIIYIYPYTSEHYGHTLQYKRKSIESIPGRPP